MITQKIKFLALAIFLFPSFLVAQVNEDYRSMSQGEQNAMSIELPNTNEKFVERAWRDFSNKFKGKTKRDKESNGWMTDEAVIKVIGGANTVDIYTSIQEDGDNVDFALFIDLGGAYVSSKSHPEEYQEAEKLLLEFALEVARKQVKEKLDLQEKELKKMEAALERLEKDNDKYHKDIEAAKERIRQREEDIAQNKKDQEETKKLIEAQHKIVKEIQKQHKDLK